MDSVGSGSLCMLSVPCVVLWTRLLLLPWDVSLCMELSKVSLGLPRKGDLVTIPVVLAVMKHK